MSSFVITVEEELLDHIGNPFSMSERAMLKKQRIEQLRKMQERAYMQGYNQAMDVAKRNREQLLEVDLRNEEMKRLSNIQQFAVEVRGKLGNVTVGQIQCQAERAAAVKCYMSEKDPLDCSSVVSAFSTCARATAHRP